MKKVLARFGLALLGVVFAAALAELMAALFFPRSSVYQGGVRLVQPSDVYGWVGKPYTEETFEAEAGHRSYARLNSQGLRDREYTFEKPPDTFRILILGDSLLVGDEVNLQNSAQYLLEESLNGDPALQGRRFEVVNGSFRGWGTGQELLFFRHDGYKYNPDLVLLAFYFGNDFQNNYPGGGHTIEGVNCYRPYFTICDGKLDAEPWPYVPGLSPALPGDCSGSKRQIARFADFFYRHSRFVAAMEPLFPHHDEAASNLAIYLDVNDPNREYQWELTGALILQLDREVRERGGDFGLVMIGSADIFRWQASDEQTRRKILAQNPVLSRADPQRPNRRLAGFLDGHGIPYLDLQPPMLERLEQTGASPIFMQDGHWNETGNRQAAGLIHEWLKERLPGFPPVDNRINNFLRRYRCQIL